MQILAEMTERDVFGSEDDPLDCEYSIRRAARGILVVDGRLALMSVSKKGYHKLPGGGIERGESVEAALLREMREETGMLVRRGKELGVVLEYRRQHKLFHISYYFECEKLEDCPSNELTEKEKAEGFELEWVELGRLSLVLAADRPADYVSSFISKRDGTVLGLWREALN
jgi:ADP-ribose pyrophosphatase